MDLSAIDYGLILTIAFLSESYSVSFGGGSIISVPALIALGIPPKIAIAHIVGSTIGSQSAGFIQLSKKSKIYWKISLFLIPFHLIGIFIGKHFLDSISEDFLLILIIIFITIYFLHSIFSKTPVANDDGKDEVTKENVLFLIILGILSGAYIAFAGLGIGIILSVLLVSFLNISFVASIGIRKMIGLPSYLLALILYAHSGLIVWKLLFSLLVVNFLAGTIGMKIFFKIPEKLAKKIFFILIVVLYAFLIYKIGVKFFL